MKKKQEKKFCSYCGTKLDQGAKFCKECGESQENQKSVRYSEKDKKSLHNSISEKEVIYEGALHKCPKCEELINSFKSYCPNCGYEIRDARSSNSIRELSLKLEKIDSQEMNIIKEKRSVMETLFGRDLKHEDEIREAYRMYEKKKNQQKVTAIINFAIPNTREDILEFMILVCSNINTKKEIDDDVSKAWISKLDQIYEKSKIVMADSSDFYQIQNMYIIKKKEIKLQRKRTFFKQAALLFGSLSILGFMINPIATVGIGVCVIILIILIANIFF